MGTVTALIATRRGRHIFQETIMRTWIIAALVAALLVGCKSTETQAPAPIEEQAPAAGAPGAGASTSGAPGSGVSGTGAGAGALSPLKDPKNILLGQKRSDAVKKLMQLLGASEIQIETVSFGKERPKSEGHDETAWAQN